MLRFRRVLGTLVKVGIRLLGRVPGRWIFLDREWDCLVDAEVVKFVVVVISIRLWAKGWDTSGCVDEFALEETPVCD